ncbi:MAG: Asp-tRNA(Asn)/Glu-tRNA(Gln) amidotransferase subunit GatC [Spirochaetes bacterium]|nr:Asp-tRNA(Asn)/Glu-tRNA(Gln) amidotransferase subunit GatC [Spirochaetota bacterium]
MELNDATIATVAKLSRLKLDDDERAKLGAQIKDIVAFVEKINELDTDAIAPTYHAVDISDVTRADTVTPSLPVDVIMKLAPESDNGHIAVPAVIE